MKLTEDEKIELVRYARCYYIVETEMDILREKLHREFDPFLEELVGRHDLELDREVEQLLVGGYWRFEFRCRIRALAASYEI